jgi:hypothetical protein
VLLDDVAVAVILARADNNRRPSFDVADVGDGKVAVYGLGSWPGFEVGLLPVHV